MPLEVVTEPLVAAATFTAPTSGNNFTATWEFGTVLPWAQYLVVLADTITDGDAGNLPLDGDWTNPTYFNPATYDANLAVAAGGADLVEEQALRWAAEFVGYPLAEGAFTSGGMTSNLTALLVARERAVPGARVDGLGGRRLAVYCSEEAHHSVVRAVETSGIGSSWVRSIALDDRRRMSPQELAAAIEELRK